MTDENKTREIGWRQDVIAGQSSVTSSVLIETADQSRRSRSPKRKSNSSRDSSTSCSSSNSSTSSSNTDDKNEKKRLKKEKREKRREEKKLKKAAKRLEKDERKKMKKAKKELHREEKRLKKMNKKLSKKSKKSKDDDEPDCAIPIDLMFTKAQAPETPEEYKERQSKIRRELDPLTGRMRLIKGDGEILEEIVSKNRHKEINKQATRGDGEYFQSNAFHFNSD